VSEREIATTIASLFNPLGNAFGQVLPPFFVKETDGGESITGMRDLMIFESMLIFVPLVVAFVFFKSEPPSPPSHSTRLKTAVTGLTQDIARIDFPAANVLCAGRLGQQELFPQGARGVLGADEQQGAEDALST
jgi:hypothetical protein